MSCSWQSGWTRSPWKVSSTQTILQLSSISMEMEWKKGKRIFTITLFCNATRRKEDHYLPPVHCPVRRRHLLSSSLCSFQGCFFLLAHLTLYLLLLLVAKDLWMHLLKKEITQLSSPCVSKQTIQHWPQTTSQKLLLYYVDAVVAEPWLEHKPWVFVPSFQNSSISSIHSPRTELLPAEQSQNRAEHPPP